MRKFSIAKIASLIFVCVMLFAALTISVCAEEATDNTDVGDVFTFSGYSINEENGDACFGFTLNHAAKDALEIVDDAKVIAVDVPIEMASEIANDFPSENEEKDK